MKEDSYDMVLLPVYELSYFQCQQTYIYSDISAFHAGLCVTMSHILPSK